MADKNETLWFENEFNGSVQNVRPGTPEHKRLLTEVIEDNDGVPHSVWKKIERPTIKSQKYEPGIQATVHAPVVVLSDEDKAEAEKSDD